MQDPTGAIVVLSRDRVMKSIIERTTLPKLANSKGLFKDAIRTIVFQQLSGSAATTIYNRMTDLVGGKRYKPSDILKYSVEELRKAGLSKQKANYVRNVAFFFSNEPRNLRNMDDETLIETLCSIKGVGSWTAKIILMFSLQRPDVFPVKDLTLRQVIIEQYKLNPGDKQVNKKIINIAKRWSPHRTIASRYLWAFSSQ